MDPSKPLMLFGVAPGVRKLRVDGLEILRRLLVGHLHCELFERVPQPGRVLPDQDGGVCVASFHSSVGGELVRELQDQIAGDADVPSPARSFYAKTVSNLAAGADPKPMRGERDAGIAVLRDALSKRVEVEARTILVGAVVGGRVAALVVHFPEPLG
jgi:hypothetical protein